MIARRLVIQHYVVATRDPHKVVAAGRREQEKKIVRRVLVGGSVVCVANVATHRQLQKLAHEVILQAGPDDLPFIVEIFRSDEADDAVDQERLESSGDSIGASFQGKLIDAVVGLGRQGAALAGLDRKSTRLNSSH